MQLITSYELFSTLPLKAVSHIAGRNVSYITCNRDLVSLNTKLLKIYVLANDIL